MKRITSFLLAVSIVMLFVASGAKKATSEGDYPIRPVPFTSVKMTDQFWAPRIKKNHEVTIPIAFGYCESTGRIKNYEIAAGLDTGAFRTLYPFDDSDVTKIIEGASYSLQTFPDSRLEAYLDSLIHIISLAQEPDGYLYTNRTIAEKGYGKVHEWAGTKRWEKDNILSHELYNMGHLYEAAVAYYEATGKKSLLDVAIKSANLICHDMGWNAFVTYPGHQVIEMGLVKLYRVTGDKKYLDQAKFFLDARGTRPDGEEYSQSHKKVVDQTEAVGHAVRATYMYSGMADIAAIMKDQAYLNAITKIWEDLVYRKMYVTGGIGASSGNEGFSEPYHLPNMSAYCETCAAIGDIFFNHRMFLIHGDSKYYDVLEKTLYNGAISGVNLAGDRFFYPNPLESAGQHDRSAWFGCACCPSNLTRILPAIPGYIYSVTDDDLYVNLYASDNADITFGKHHTGIVQQTSYPWDGEILLTINPPQPEQFTIHLRIPGWARNEAIPGSLYAFADKTDKSWSVKINGTPLETKVLNGYALLSRKWKPGDQIILSLPMPVRKVVADSRVREDSGRYAVQRGPLMFCAEWPDNPDGHVLDLVVRENPEFNASFKKDLLNGTEIITTSGHPVVRNLDGSITRGKEEKITLIPYYLWNNRGPGEMKVWLPFKDSCARPLPAPTLAFTSKLSASSRNKNLSAVTDQLEPSGSGDQTNPNFNWWPHKDQWEWIQFDFGEKKPVSKVKVYWFDDGPSGGCRIPDQYEILYRNGENWEKTEPVTPLIISKDAWNIAEFKTVTTSALRLRLRLNKDFSSGIHEVVIE